ncbi:MAG: hypothetical protein K0R51_2191 [Cytophagaceae bacterium]|nr:hypothetical protein [Cytophagaceae bacterium]
MNESLYSHFKPTLFIGWMMGLEPTTLGTTNRCSNRLSYNHRVRNTLIPMTKVVYLLLLYKYKGLFICQTVSADHTVIHQIYRLNTPNGQILGYVGSGV